ncbi:MAG: WHG domain-containing protein [Filomicrobium sp.]
MSGAGEGNFRERLRERLLASAEAIVIAEGLSGLQARRVAQDADCSIGTVYNIFGDIDGLILETNARTLEELGRLVGAAARRSTGQSLEGRLTTLAVAYLDYATANQLRWRAVFEHHLPEGKEFPEEHRENRQRMLALIGAQLEGAIADPSSRADAANALFSSVHGIVLLSLDGKLAPFDPAQCERQIRFLVSRAVIGIEQG